MTEDIYMQRLRNLVKSTEEAKPETFNMWHYNKHGSPGCVFGNYAARTDLQDVFELCSWSPHNVSYKGSEGNVYTALVEYIDPRVLEHFNISLNDARLIFDVDGCGGAKTPEEAATFIKLFIEKFDLGRRA